MLPWWLYINRQHDVDSGCIYKCYTLVEYNDCLLVMTALLCVVLVHRHPMHNHLPGKSGLCFAVG